MSLLLMLVEEHAQIATWKWIVSQFLGFGVLALILWFVARPILARMASSRSKGIADAFAKLESEVAETSRKLEEYKSKLAAIEKELQARIAAAQAEGEKSRATLMAEATAAAAAEGERARRDVAVERDKAVLELRAAVTEATVRATERIVDAVVNEQLSGRMVNKYLGDLEKAVK